LYLAAASPAAARQAPAADPDALYRDREQLESARQAADIWAARAAGGADVDAAWKLARASYWIGTQGEARERRASLERGVKAGEQAARLAPNQPEGHFWLAANMGALAESFGLMQGLRYRGRIKDALVRVLVIDPAWQQGSADRALGRWYFRVPGLFGGSRRKAREHLDKALAYHPQSTLTLLFLADLAAAEGKRDEARAFYQRVIDAPGDPEWAPEDRVNTRLAAERLQKLKLTTDDDTAR
jgi:tetratricopeptide (TPR) repeat protein